MTFLCVSLVKINCMELFWQPARSDSGLILSSPNHDVREKSLSGLASGPNAHGLLRSVGNQLFNRYYLNQKYSKDIVVFVMEQCVHISPKIMLIQTPAETFFGSKTCDIFLSQKAGCFVAHFFTNTLPFLAKRFFLVCYVV